MNYYIITGASRGLGQSLAIRLMNQENFLICLSRTKSDKLIKLAREKDIGFSYYTCDLSQENEIEVTLKSIEKDIDFSKANKIILINNAGLIEPIKTIGNAESKMISMNISVNLIAPMLLTNWIVKRVIKQGKENIIVNVSSGASNRPMHGWSTYCSSKAGLDMFTKTVGIELAKTGDQCKIISFSPGIMDTEMQGEIRNADEEDFATLKTFIEYKEKNLLRTPDYVAQKLIELLEKPLQNGEVYDIKQLID